MKKKAEKVLGQSCTVVHEGHENGYPELYVVAKDGDAYVIVLNPDGEYVLKPSGFLASSIKSML